MSYLFLSCTEKKSIKDDEAEVAQLKEPRTIEHQANSSDVTTDSKSHIKS